MDILGFPIRSFIAGVLEMSSTNIAPSVFTTVIIPKQKMSASILMQTFLLFLCKPMKFKVNGSKADRD
jgi:hypothetical protein